MKQDENNRQPHSATRKITPPATPNETMKEEQKKRGQLPLHDEPIGGA
jgi:hypothetical protein